MSGFHHLPGVQQPADWPPEPADERCADEHGPPGLRNHDASQEHCPQTLQPARPHTWVWQSCLLPAAGWAAKTYHLTISGRATLSASS